MKAFTPLILIIVSVITAYFFVYPYYGEINDLRAEEAEYDDVLIKVSEIEKVKAEKLRVLDEISDIDKSKLDIMIRKESAPLELAHYMEDLADQIGIEFEFINTVTEDESNNSETRRVRSRSALQPVSTTLEFESTYGDFLELLQAIETNLELADIVNVSVSDQTESISSSVFNFSITFQTYVLPLPNRSN